MLQRLIYIAALTFAILVLSISIFRTSRPDFVFYQPSASLGKEIVSPIEYYLPYHGILPNHPLWSLKALRDKVWFSLTRDPIKKAQLLLLFSDKRLGMAGQLIKDGEGNLGVATAIKAEHYLKDAFDEYKKADKMGMDTADFLQRITRASLKHREALEQFLETGPADAGPVVAETLNIPKWVYERSVQELNRKEIDVPALHTRD